MDVDDNPLGLSSETERMEEDYEQLQLALNNMDFPGTKRS